MAPPSCPICARPLGADEEVVSADMVIAGAKALESDESVFAWEDLEAFEVAQIVLMAALGQERRDA